MHGQAIGSGAGLAVRETFQGWFILSAGVLLAATGLAKVVSAFGSAKILAFPDPLLGIAFGYVMLVVGALELGIAALCFSRRHAKLALWAVAWLTTNFMLYRIGLWAMDWHRPCPCLGNLTDALRLSPQAADATMKGILAYLACGSCMLLMQGKRSSFQYSTRIALIAVPLVLGAQGAERGFVVAGSVRHEQFGAVPKEAAFDFTARSDGHDWSLKMVPKGDPGFDEIVAVGKGSLMFVSIDLTGAARKAQAASEPYGINDYQACVLPYGVPNSPVVPELSPVWLTYLSASYLGRRPALQMPPPTSASVAGGSWLPPFSGYELKTFVAYDDQTALPKELIAVDDGFQMGIMSGKLVRARRYPPPYASGMTNVMFKVERLKELPQGPLPQLATLEVYWVGRAGRELVHRFTIDAKGFTEAPDSSIPDLAVRGITAVTDARIPTPAGPVAVDYLATNRYLEPSELTNLPSFKAALRRAMLSPTGRVLASGGHTLTRFVILTLLFLTAAVPAAVWFRRRRKKT